MFQLSVAISDYNISGWSG